LITEKSVLMKLGPLSGARLALPSSPFGRETAKGAGCGLKTSSGRCGTSGLEPPQPGIGGDWVRLYLGISNDVGSDQAGPVGLWKFHARSEIGAIPPQTPGNRRVSFSIHRQFANSPNIVFHGDRSSQCQTSLPLPMGRSVDHAAGSEVVIEGLICDSAQSSLDQPGNGK